MCNTSMEKISQRISYIDNINETDCAWNLCTNLVQITIIICTIAEHINEELGNDLLGFFYIISYF